MTPAAAVWAIAGFSLLLGFVLGCLAAMWLAGRRLQWEHSEDEVRRATHRRLNQEYDRRLQRPVSHRFDPRVRPAGTAVKPPTVGPKGGAGDSGAAISALHDPGCAYPRRPCVCPVENRMTNR